MIETFLFKSENSCHRLYYKFTIISTRFQLNLESIHAESRDLEDSVKRIMNGSISNDILQVRWPLGVPPPNLPETRYDLQTWSLMNETHQIMPNSDDNTKLMSKIDQEDVKVSKFVEYVSVLSSKTNGWIVPACSHSNFDRSEKEVSESHLSTLTFVVPEV